MSGWPNSPLQIPINFFLHVHRLLLHKMLMCSAESRTTWKEAAETRLLFRGRGVTLPPTAWQANTNFLLWMCAWLAATLQFSSVTEPNNYTGLRVHFWGALFVFVTQPSYKQVPSYKFIWSAFYLCHFRFHLTAVDVFESSQSDSAASQQSCY